jgi:Fur family ferric uptake transcriptional regulator
MTSIIEKLCIERNIRLTQNRKIVAKVISESKDHPDVEEIWHRANKISKKIGIATVYRAVKMFDELGLIARHDFGGEGKSRYEILEADDHHDHLIDITNHKIIEFVNDELEKFKTKIAKDMGYELVGHRLELYCKPLDKKKK